MHAFHVPPWAYVFFVLSAAILLAGVSASCIVIRLRERLNWRGYALLGAMLVLGAIGCSFFGGLIGLVKGLA